nr:hypothetical protein [Tanacetum cinerariifolium]
RQAYTPATIDTESKPEEAPSETEEFQPLATRTAPLSSDHTPTSSDLTPISPLTDEEFEASEPTDIRITPSHSIAPSDSTTPLSPDHPFTQTSPTPTRVSYYRSTARMAVQLIEDIEEKSLDLNTKGNGLEDEGFSSEEEEKVAPEGEGLMPSTFEIGQSYRPVSEQRRVEETPAPRPPVCATWVDNVDGTIYTDISIYVLLVCVPVQTLPSPECSSGSLPVSPSSLAVPTLVASPSTTPTITIAVDEDEFLKVGARLELYGSILHDRIQRLDALPPTLFEGYDRDFRDLYTRLRDVRDKIFSQRYRLMSL